MHVAWEVFQTVWPLLAFGALMIAFTWFPGGDPGRY